MKKLVAILLTLGMMIGFSAAADANNDSGKGVAVGEFLLEFPIQTVTDENHIVTRTYTPPREGMYITTSWGSGRTESYRATPISLGRRATTGEDVKELLSDLGMSDAIIADMNPAQLMEIARAESVTTQIAYLKGDAEGNVTYVTEEEALANADTLESVSSETSIPGPGEDIGFEDEISDDEYLKTSIIILNRGSAKYKVTLDCEWLKMPKYRSTDSIGISIENQTIEQSTCTGWVSYTRSNSIKGTSKTESEGIPSNQFKFAELDPWQGAAMLFNLKNDWVMGDHFFNYRAHMEVYTQIENPNRELFFDLAWTYHHSQATVDMGKATVSMISRDDTRVSIGIDNKSFNRYDGSIRSVLAYIPG